VATIEVRSATPADANFVRTALERSWGSTIVVARGEAIDASSLAALVAWRDDESVGLLTYRPGPSSAQWEIVSIDAFFGGAGVGTSLLSAVRALAREHGVGRLWLVTTNDNMRAIRFYQRRGFDLVAVHRDAITAARKLKPSIPLEADGIPLRHELEFELTP